MGERKGTNKYYPPDFDPKKHKSLTGYTGAHPLRERARKLHLGILIIRFEMPYNIWCGGCGNPIGMGVRYNAEKSKVGMYYTTPIYKFRMKCHLCDNHFEIKTDPANHDYVIINGARRKEQRWDPKENEQIVPEDKASQKKLALDAMYKLEHGADDKAKNKAARPGIGQLEALQAGKRDDYILNKLARQKFRNEKKTIKTLVDTDKALLAKSSLDIDLVSEHADDVKLAGLLQYSAVHTFDEKQKMKREQISSRPLFGSSASSSTPSSSSSSSESSGTPTSSLQQCRKQQQLAEARKRMGLASSKSKAQGFGSSPASKSLTPDSLGITKRGASSSDTYVTHHVADRLAQQSPTTELDPCDGAHVLDAQNTGGSTQSEGTVVTSSDSERKNTSERQATNTGLGSLISNYDSSSSEGD